MGIPKSVGAPTRYFLAVCATLVAVVLSVLSSCTVLRAQDQIGQPSGGAGFVYTGVLSGIPATCTVGQIAFITDATAGQNQYNCTATNTWTQNLNSGTGGANTALSNLASVSINTSLLAQTGVDLGGTTKPFRNIFFYGGGTFGTNYFEFTGTPTSTDVITVPDAAADTMVLLAATQSLTNKTVDGVTPTVMGYVDATSSIQTQLNTKAPTASPTFTGTPAAPTPTGSDNTTKIATTAFVKTNLGSYCALAGCTMTGPLTFTSLVGSGSDSFITLPSNTMHMASTGDFWNNAGLLEFNDGTATRYVPSVSATTTTTTFVPFATATAGLYTARAIATGDLPAALANQTSVNGTSIPSSVTLTQTIASGTSTMGTGAISSGACASAVTTTATGTATTDAIIIAVNADPTATTGYAPSASGSLYIWSYPTSGNVNFKVCNNTAGSITPSAITINWRVVR